MNAYQTEYLRAWKKGFAEFLGWGEDETVSWAEPFLARMDPPGAIINEPPLFYVARELAWRQSHYDQLSQSGKFDFIRAIQDILAPNHERDFNPNFDFAAARKRLEKLVDRTKPKE